MGRRVSPEYWRLDDSGEAEYAAWRVEARAEAAASEEMFLTLVVPLLTPPPRTVLELGCGTAALSRRIARAVPQARVHATDKSEGMLAVAARHVRDEGLTNVALARWDVTAEPGPPIEEDELDLVVSSVVVPYLGVRRTEDLVRRLAARLAPGGVLAFLEQDLMTDSVQFPSWDLCRRVFDKDNRPIGRAFALGLRPVLRAAGLEVLPRRSFLWTDDDCAAYVSDLLERYGDEALDAGRITAAERAKWDRTFEDLRANGDFYYGLVYHLVAGRRPTVVGPTPARRARSDD